MGIQTLVEIHLKLCLPRDELSIPVARHICRNSLAEVGVQRDCSGDIEVALTEACTNVLDHSGDGDEYEIQLGIEDDLCTIRVVDTGRGFDSESLQGLPDDSAEGGRGLVLMRALVDRALFTSRPEAGTIVHLEKDLSFVPGAAGLRLR